MKNTRSLLIDCCLVLGVLLCWLTSTGRAQQVATGGGNGGAGEIAAPVPADASLVHAKYLDPTVAVAERVDDLFARLTPLEKAALLHGCSGMGYGNIPRIGLPEILMTDGPQGVRLDKGTTTAFPCGLAMAATMDSALVEQAGKAMGEECRALNRRVFLAPGVNIMRTPLGGRNFEYMGEDPFLSGKTAAAYIRGVQSQGVSACVKHWNFNEQEHWRTTINVECGERALHEIYGVPFEMAVNYGRVLSVMPAYNRFNGDYCTASKPLNRDLLEGVYGFDGVLISDWGAWHDDKLAIAGGCTIEMPSERSVKHDQSIVDRIAKGEISQADVDAAVRRNLRFLFYVGAFDAWSGGALNTPDHEQVSRRAAAESIVLLKNKHDLLPLDIKKFGKIVVVGPNAEQFQTMADGSNLSRRGGSGATRPPYEVTPWAALKKRFGDKIIFEPGLSFESPLPTNSEARAIDAAKHADAVIFFAGTNHRYDREALGWGDVKNADRPDLEFIGPQADLIRKIAAVNSKTIVVMINGGPVSVESWHEKVPAIVETWYSGMESGNAIADVLFGDVNPSGKLPCTFGKQLNDWLCHQLGTNSFPGTGNNGVVKYLDDIWVGYRHFDQANITPRYPFGYGLSYTTYTYGKPSLSATTMKGDDILVLSIPITNTGKRAGAEAVELYLHESHPGVARPPQELKGIARVFLQLGETRVAYFAIQRRDLSYWDVDKHDWMAKPGMFEARIGASSRDIRATAQFKLL